jgi:glycosyltransferase involved in cell wall biosynthesis
MKKQFHPNKIINLPDYSFVICVYSKDSPAFLEKALISIFNQTLFPKEVILVEDGPLTNKLVQLIEYFQKKYEGILRVIKNEKNIGFSLSLNKGILACKTEFVARMDSDDISREDRIEKQLLFMVENSDISILGTYIFEFEKEINEEKYLRVVPLENKEIKILSRRRSPFNHPTVIFRKKSIIEGGLYKNIERKEDLELFGRLLFKGYKGANIPIPLLFYRTDNNNIKRKKKLVNIKNYLNVIFNFFLIGHSSLLDLIIVFFYQISFLLFPISLLKLITQGFYRKKWKRK